MSTWMLKAAALPVALLLIAGCSASNGSEETAPGVKLRSQATATTASPDAAPKSPSATKSPSASKFATEAPPTSGPKSKGSMPDPRPIPAARPKNQAEVLSALPGSATSKCVAVRSRRDVRSGGIAAGNFADARATYADQAGSKEQPEVFIYVIPQHSNGMRGVSVTLTPTGRGKATTVRTKTGEKANLWRYYPVRMNVPQPGRYRITIKSSPDTGCFLVDFTKK